MIVQKVKNEFKKHNNNSIKNLFRDIYIHDMKTIFTKIFMSAELCSHYVDNSNKYSDILNLLEIMNEQIKRGHQLFQSKQRFDKVGKNKIDHKPVKLLKVINETIYYIKKVYNTQNLSIKLKLVDNDMKLHSEDFLKIIFENILINAIKYNNNQHVKITIKISEKFIENEQFVKIEFIDNGIGVPNSSKEAIFLRHSKDKGGKGMGLGLSLIKEIVKTLNGKIWVQDRIKGNYQKGSNFVLTIPKYFV
ncbi:MAG: sensor histidine kinase [Promethearchaeota archaeon]